MSTNSGSLYHDVLRSDRWRLLKWRRICHAQFKCERCGITYKAKRPKAAMRAFQLHHEHYRTVGSEALDDVRVLCRNCHAQIHGVRA